MPLALIATAALALAGCSDSAGTGDATGTDGSGSPAASSSTTATAGSPTPTNTEQPLESQIAAGCPTGRWVLDNDVWGDLLRSMIPSEGSLDSVEGEVFLSLGADGSYSTVYQDWTMTMSVEGGTAVITRDGTDSGTWADRDGRAVLTDESSGSAVTGYVESPQGRIDMPTTDGVPTNVGESFAYECEGTTLLATTDEGTFTFTWAP